MLRCVAAVSCLALSVLACGEPRLSREGATELILSERAALEGECGSVQADLTPEEVQKGLERELWQEGRMLWDASTGQGVPTYALSEKGKRYFKSTRKAAAMSRHRVFLLPSGSTTENLLFSLPSADVSNVVVNGLAESALPDGSAGGRRADYVADVVLTLPEMPGVLATPRSPGACNGVAYFRLYDDGWRLEVSKLMSIAAGE